MSNNSYKRGRQLERDIVNQARKEGKIAFRSAASKSPIDVCIIDHKEGHIEFIQCKTGILSKKAKERILAFLNSLTREYMADFKLIHKLKAYSKKEKI